MTVIGPESKAGPWLVRAGRRLAYSVRARSLARYRRRALRRVGYSEAGVLFWDLGGRAALPGVVEGGGTLAERLARYALVLGRRGPPEPTVAAAALAASGARQVRWASMQPGLVVVAADGVLLRVAIGRSVMQMDNAAAALSLLCARDLPEVVTERVPWPLGRGREGLADWSLERLLPGTRASREVPEPLFTDCLDFLVELGRVHTGDAARSFGELADTVARVLPAEGGAAVREVAAVLERELGTADRCFAHGDFFAGNLLTEEGRLTGVVDWDSAGAGRLPLLDLLHLLVTRTGPFADDEWGRAVQEHLLPLARAGGDDAVRRYCSEVGLPAEPALLEAFVWAYWLDYAAYQLRTHLVRRSQPRWVERNLEQPARSAAEALAR
jgi:aminoglycoside phosphotransferase (APT) family kinase protein